MAEFNIVVTQTTSGKEITIAVEPEFTIQSVLDVLVENLKLKDRFVLATTENKILDPDITVQDAGLEENSKLLLIPDPTGGN
ncbi:MAG: hypothetical protein V1811_00320 [Candidatus Micrarchaeota archaeon]